MNNRTHYGIREAIRKRIVAGEWSLGELIPGEADFAEHYGCSRTTVNRALQALSDEGIVERKRKGGTRVRPLPLSQAQLRIPLLREQVEERGGTYRFEILARHAGIAPKSARERLGLDEEHRAAYLATLHLSDGNPFAFESRWVNLKAVPGFETADFGALSANEWLVRTVPFTRGEVSLSATPAQEQVAKVLAVRTGDALFTMERITWLDDSPITAMTLHYAPGYRLEFTI